LGRKSVRRNALIADLLHHIDFIEKAGTGIKRIRDDVHAQGCPEPAFENNGFFTAIFRPNPEVRGAARLAPDATPQVPRKYPASTPQVLAMLTAASTGEKSREELQTAAGVRDREHFRKEYLNVLLEAGLLELTIPDKPRSSRQRYRPTSAGIQFLRRFKEPE
jgi:ATP-dependent DNA helicase RecG